MPALGDQPSFLVMDLFAAHKTEEVLDTLRANDITVSMIPGGCTGLVQPIDVSINRPFKDILKVKEGGGRGGRLIFDESSINSCIV